MEERNEDVLAEARRYLSDLVAFEGNPVYSTGGGCGV